MNQTRKRVYSKKQSKRSNRKKNKGLQFLVLSGLALAMILLFAKPYIQNKTYDDRRDEIEFTKEGQLTFFDRENHQFIKTIDIEIAEGEYETALGLMYRYSMSDSAGMLFIMDKEEPKSFWMKDTYISLDIIYLNKNLEIVTIQKYTHPLSEQSIPSYKKAKYVIEVNAGFCDKLNIEEGDTVSYEKLVVDNKI